MSTPPNEDYPEGFAMNLTEGVLRVRYRDSWERPSPMINSNSGEPEGAMEHPRTARNQIFTGTAHPSHVILPVIPR